MKRPADTHTPVKHNLIWACPLQATQRRGRWLGTNAHIGPISALRRLTRACHCLQAEAPQGHFFRGARNLREPL
jgi:hypothetical protein